MWGLEVANDILNLVLMGAILGGWHWAPLFQKRLKWVMLIDLVPAWTLSRLPLE